MKALLLLVPMTISNVALATPAVGDYSKYDIKYPSGKTVTQTLEIINYSYKGFLVRSTIYRSQVPVFVQENWESEDRAGGTSQLWDIEHCSEIGELTVAAGKFRGCDIKRADYEGFWAKQVPFNKLVFEKREGMVFELLEFRVGK